MHEYNRRSVRLGQRVSLCERRDGWARLRLPAGADDAGVNVSALVEPDGDGDHFEDVTQDRCPNAAGPVDGCAPAPRPRHALRGDLRTSRVLGRPSSVLQATKLVSHSGAASTGERLQTFGDRAVWKRLNTGRPVLRVWAVEQGWQCRPHACGVAWRIEHASERSNLRHVTPARESRRGLSGLPLTCAGLAHQCVARPPSRTQESD